MRNLSFRQGDVGFVEGSIPKTAKRIPLRPLAYGERTGHSHAVVADAADLVEMYEDEDGTVWIKALGDLPIRHEDHDPTASVSIVPAGWQGEIRICGEYDEEVDFRQVED